MARFIPGTPYDDEIVPTVPGVSIPNVQKSRGIHAEFPSSTPKYTRGDGERTDNYDETLARLYVEVTDAERVGFLNAISDADTRALAAALTGYGYIDFILQRVNHNFAEKADVIEHLADGFVVYFFGQSAPIFNYSGTLVNSLEDDQMVGMYRLYRDVLRGSQLARTQKIARLRYDSYIISGAMMNLQQDMESSNEMVTAFNFQFIAKTVNLLPNPERGVTLVDEAFDAGGVLQKSPRATPQTAVYRTVAIPPAASKAAAGPPTQATPPVTETKTNDEKMGNQANKEANELRDADIAAALASGV